VLFVEHLIEKERFFRELNIFRVIYKFFSRWRGQDIDSHKLIEVKAFVTVVAHKDSENKSARYGSGDLKLTDFLSPAASNFLEVYKGSGLVNESHDMESLF